jgi:hypothetical protein
MITHLLRCLFWWFSCATPTVKRTTLVVEVMEDRTLLSSYDWTGKINSDWTNPGNWTGGPEGTFPKTVADTAKFVFMKTPVPAVVDANIEIGGLILRKGFNNAIVLSNKLKVDLFFRMDGGRIRETAPGANLELRGVSTWTGGVIEDPNRVGDMVIVKGGVRTDRSSLTFFRQFIV